MAAQIEAANPGLRTEIRVIKTQGDLVQDKPLQEFGTKGVFVQEIEQALLHGTIDLAVHSLKDMPAEQPEDLTMSQSAAMWKRACAKRRKGAGRAWCWRRPA